MGCATSKLDDLPAVSLCRDRCAFLDEAIRHRFAFSQAHAAYLHSLNSLALSLDRFFNLHFDAASSPLLPPPDKLHHHIHSRPDSGSHLHFHSDSDSDDDDDDDNSGSDTLHHHDVSSPVHPYISSDYQNLNINYMKKQTMPSQVYAQRPMSPQNMHMGESSSHYYPPNYPYYANNNQNHNTPYHNYSLGNNFNGYPNPPAVASSSRPPPPPPSPPRSSTWDFLNPFETFEKYYPPYTPSRDSKEVREEEGIPELEDDDDDEVVKEVHVDQKFVDSRRSSYSKPGGGELEEDAQLQHKPRHSVGVESDPVKYEVHMVNKKLSGDEQRSNAAGMKTRGGFKGDLEVVKEIQLQFLQASECGSELAKFLEVGKLQYIQKHSGHHVSSKILHLPMASMPRSSDNADPAFIEDLELRSKTLSSTLHKLHLWEKKLYQEVKIEEKMRILHERKLRKLKHLDERGADDQKVHATRTLVRSLSTKIRIAIQVVDKISVKINNLRDEELWPQLNELIQGLGRMWKSMLECHHNQCEAIGEAKQLDAIALRKHSSDAHFEATRQLQHDLINWTLGFSCWVGAQKGYIGALNNWLMKCLLYVPEETDDGIVPFSPTRIGAPRVFIVCNQWSQSLNDISEKEVVDSMRDLASNVSQLWDRDKAEIRQRMLGNKDERKIKSLDKEDQKIQKEIQALDKKMDNGMMPLSGNLVYQSETTKGSLQASLQHVLEAMEKFTAKSLKVYQELLQRIEEDHLAQQEPETVS